MRHPIALLAIVFLMAACQTATFEARHEMANNQWALTDSVVFTVPVTDTAGIYDIWITATINETYSYQNLWLQIQTQAPSGASQQEALNMFFMNDQGQWLGHTNGEQHSRRKAFKRLVRFPLGGEYRFVLKHNMRQQQLKGVKALELTLAPTPQNLVEQLNQAAKNPPAQ